eukprot:10245420-Alexandrium_andersonii.AAC.1
MLARGAGRPMGFPGSCRLTPMQSGRLSPSSGIKATLLGRRASLAVKQANRLASMATAVVATQSARVAHWP